MGKFTKYMSDLIWLLAGIKSQGKPDGSFHFTETFTVTGKLWVLKAFRSAGQVQFKTLEPKFFSRQLSDFICILLGFCVPPSKGGHSVQRDLQNLRLTGLKYRY